MHLTLALAHENGTFLRPMILIFKYLSMRASGKINVKAKLRKLLHIKMAEKQNVPDRD